MRNPFKKPLRRNVLILVSYGYIATLLAFVVMVFYGGMTPDNAYDLIQGPLMTLIGGSLAIAKDLLNSEDESVGSPPPDRVADPGKP